MPSVRLREHRSIMCAVTALMLLATACSSAPTGTGLQTLSLDLAFGVKSVSGAPANFTPPAIDIPPPPDFDFPDDFGPFPTTPLCPNAAVNAFPEEEAGLTISLNKDGSLRMPRKGVYRWKRKGTLTVMGFKVPLAGFESRAIRRVTEISDTKYSFQTIQDELSGERVITTFTVNTDAAQQSVNPPLGVRPPIRAGDPERGVALTKVETYDSSGAILDTFEPHPGILLLPLPVSPGEEWSSHGVDPVSGATMDHDSKLVGRARVDACGDIVDGWLMKGTEKITDPARGADPTRGRVITRTYNYIVAPQLGGILISEDINSDSPENTGTRLDALFELGQFDPSPLPENFK